MTLRERYSTAIKGTITCLDRVVVKGTLPGLGYADGMTKYLVKNKIRIFDYPDWANSFRERLRANAESLALQAGVKIDFVSSSKIRKEEIVERALEQRGSEPGLVYVISAMEGCGAYRPWHDKKAGRTFLKFTKSQCLHYYFYFIDELLGLVYVRVPTWCPFRLQFYFNGHNALARRLDEEGISYALVDNAFVDIDDFAKAQALANAFDVREIHERLDHYARLCCPVIEDFDTRYHWSLWQVEYASDIVFRERSELQPVYDALLRSAVTAVKVDNVAMFLGRMVDGRYKGELGSDFSTRVQGTRIKHHMGRDAAIKMYDKHGIVLRIETTANDVSFFKHYREVEHRDGTTSHKVAPVKKSIYSLHALEKLLGEANERYLRFVSTLDDPAAGVRDLAKAVEPRKEGGRNYKGLDFFVSQDQELFEAILRGEHNISGFRNKDIRRHLPHLSSAQVSRLFKRLRVHGLIKRVRNSFKYYPTALGRRVFAAGLTLKEMFLKPELARLALASA